MRTSSLIYWFILPMLLLTPTIRFSLDRKRWNHVLLWLIPSHLWLRSILSFFNFTGWSIASTLKTVHMTPALHTALSLVETSLNSVVSYYFIITAQYPNRQCWFQGICAQAYCGMVFVHLFYLLIGYRVLTYRTVYVSHVTVSYDRMCVCYHQASPMDVN